MAKFKISQEKNKCIGCAACTVTCDNWKMAGDKAVPKKTELNDLGCNMDAAQGCPVRCIHITDTKSKKKLI